MRLYIDDDSVKAELIRRLRQAGHDVLIPADIGESGAHDPVHLRLAILDQRTLLSANCDDFEELHDLLIAGKGHQHGIFVIRKENDPTRDTKPQHIVRAIDNLLAAGIPIADEFITLNHWR
ncbi:MAG: DUF5615 family PIN-like protein [Gemmataceae bacterium]